MKKDYWLALLSALSWAAVLLMLPRLPEQVPMHWGIGGQIDRWGSRLNLIWLGALPLGIWTLITVLPAADPRRENYRSFAPTFRIIRAAAVILTIAITWITSAAAAGKSVNVMFSIKILMGMMFIVLGNFLTRVRPTWFVGIRTPWTLSDPRIWKKTHRLGGFLMVIGGALFAASAFFFPGPAGFIIPVAVLIGGCAADVIYSAVLWMRYHRGEKPAPLNPNSRNRTPAE